MHGLITEHSEDPYRIFESLRIAVDGEQYDATLHEIAAVSASGLLLANVVDAQQFDNFVLRNGVFVPDPRRLGVYVGAIDYPDNFGAVNSGAAITDDMTHLAYTEAKSPLSAPHTININQPYEDPRTVKIWRNTPELPTFDGFREITVDPNNGKTFVRQFGEQRSTVYEFDDPRAQAARSIVARDLLYVTRGIQEHIVQPTSDELRQQLERRIGKPLIDTLFGQQNGEEERVIERKWGSMHIKNLKDLLVVDLERNGRRSSLEAYFDASTGQLSSLEFLHDCAGRQREQYASLQFTATEGAIGAYLGKAELEPVDVATDEDNRIILLGRPSRAQRLQLVRMRSAVSAVFNPLISLARVNEVYSDETRATRELDALLKPVK